jgi:hypothetical protein
MKLLTFCVLLVLCVFSKFTYALVIQQPPPPIPRWPEVFSVSYDVLVEKYGDWKRSGNLNYHWPNKTFRADYIDWCLPLFDSGSSENNDYTCSFLATKGNMYFVNHTSEIWAENDCCMFEAGLGATSPDWMKNDQYNGTGNIRGIAVDVWWFPGTNDPSKPCYGYWNRRDKMNTPVRFFGLSSLGPTILDYHSFKPNVLVADTDLSLPHAGCDKVCEPPILKKRSSHRKHAMQVAPPGLDWPSCE